MTRVGPKGQIVIEKDLRKRLGIGPGWHAVQDVRDNELVVRFQPPVHRRSLAGALRQYADGVAPPTEEQIDEAVAAAIAENWREREGAGDFGR